MMTLKEWRKWRDQAGILLAMFDDAPKDRRNEAWRIYHLWRDWKISFTEAKRRIKALAKK